MTREKYVGEINKLMNNVRLMGVQLEATLAQVVQNLASKDEVVAQTVIAQDDVFDNSEVDIERQCLNLILKQTPVAKDLREVVSCLKLVSDMERIADHCGDISQYTLRLAALPSISLPEDYARMLQRMQEMVISSIGAFSENDTALAEQVIAMDDEVDAYFAKLRQELTAQMEVQPRAAQQYVAYIMIAKYVERIADHATNIAEWELFLANNKLCS